MSKFNVIIHNKCNCNVRGIFPVNPMAPAAPGYSQYFKVCCASDAEDSQAFSSPWSNDIQTKTTHHLRNLTPAS